MVSAFKRKLRDFLRHQAAVGARSDEVIGLLRRIETRLAAPAAGIPPAPPARPPPETPPETPPGTPRHSYAIEAEDLIIERLLNVFVLGFQWRKGRYIDIGAHHPVTHSNTYLLYRRGWTGVCVEPNPSFADDFAALRPDDVFVNAGLSGTASRLTYHLFDDPLINGFFGQDVIEGLRREGKRHLGSVEMPCLGVRDFLSTYVSGPVDVLNIDIETRDVAVLAAWDWDRCRPSVICAEIVEIRISRALRSDLAGVLAKAGYSMVSRGWQSAFFVADEHLERFAAANDWPLPRGDAA